MIEGTSIRQSIVLGLATLALLGVWLTGLTAAASILTYPFVFVGPGVAVAAALRLRDPLLEAALLVPTSLIVQMLIATLFVYAGMYTADLVLVTTVVFALGALAADGFISRRMDGSTTTNTQI